MPTTTVITGGAGFIGSHLCEKLLAQGQHVIAIDNFDTYYDPARKHANIAGLISHPAFTLVEADIRDRAALTALFKERKPDRVANLAAIAGVRASIERAAEYVDVNLNGTINVMDAARAVGVPHVLLGSTSSVYGASEEVPFTEDQSTDHPLAPYPASKKAAELMAYAYHNLFGTQFTILRFFTVYGPRVRPDMMAFMVIDKLIKGEAITLFDNEDLRRDWTYVDDICAGVMAALDKPQPFEIINIGRGQPVRLRDFVDILSGLVGESPQLKITPTPVSEPPVTYASIDKARRLLGYEPNTSINEGLAATWAWYQQEFHIKP
jgi:UDP-glucuronate 4-epimerase